MLSIVDLWLPILLSSVAVFIASSIIWMVMPHHKKDWGKLPDEDKIREAMRAAGVQPGQYSVPNCGGDMKAMQEPGFVKKMEAGPVGLMIVNPNGLPRMGKSLGLWFLYSLAIGVVVAYLCSRTLDPGEHYLTVFRIAGTMAVMAYCAAIVPGAIWWGRTWSSIFKEVADGAVYGLLTAGCFGALWPAA